jgi:hypothetical protein
MKPLNMNSNAANGSALISNQNLGKSFSLMNKFQNGNNSDTNAGFHHSSNVSTMKNFDEDSQNLMTIAMLSPVCDPNWKVKARILKKNDIKNYKTAKGEGCLFSIDIMDRNQTEISCSFFNAGCDKWFDYLNEGSIYIFSGGIIKENNSRYKYVLRDFRLKFS